MTNVVARHLAISGQVQGVGYRHAMRETAARLNLTGWVRNRRDDSVEAMVCGTAAAVDAMIAWARQGPPSAVVSAVSISDGSGQYDRFEIRPIL